MFNNTIIPLFKNGTIGSCQRRLCGGSVLDTLKLASLAVAALLSATITNVQAAVRAYPLNEESAGICARHGDEFFAYAAWTMMPLAVAVLLSATTAGAETTAASTRPANEEGVDSNIKPGDDFFAYANGGWLKSTEIPTGKERWGPRNEIGELTRQQIVKLLADAASAPVDTAARKVADFQAAYLDEAAIEAKGIAPLKPALDRIRRVRNKKALAQLLGSELRADVDPLNLGIYNSSHVLGLAVTPGLHGEKTNIALLLQGGLGMPDRDDYVNPAPQKQELRTKYQTYIGRVLSLAGFSDVAVATKRAEAVMAFETALAQRHATSEVSSDDHNVDHLWARADFSQKASGMDWSAFFAAAGLSKQETFVAWQPDAVKGVAALVASESLDVWKDYLRFHLIDRNVDILPRAFADAGFAFRGKDASDRSQRATEATLQAMSDAVGKMYAERHFPVAYKARVQTIATNVIDAFRRRIDALTWMSPATKSLALAKLKTLYFGVGYPEAWQDISGLKIDPRDAAGNLQRVADWNRRNALARLGRPVDKSAWWMTPQTVGAVLIFQQNAYNFPAALLQAPKFDPTASDAMNYGAIGAIVGHEVSHFVDTLGMEYDAQGALQHWWTTEDMNRYQALADQLANQYSNYRPLPDAPINGKQTSSENIADLGGLAAAFDAYRRTLGSKANDKDYLRQQDRQFFIGYARSWRGKMTDEALRKYLATDIHAPERYRIATVRNLDAWYEAFDVLQGQRLYLEPKARVRVW